jgi:hypothetical protein
MARFYLLPQRSLVNLRFMDYASLLLPGLTNPGGVDFVAMLHELGRRQPGIYLVHREDLPLDEDPVQALVDGFGAETGDEIIEVRTGGRPSETTFRRWCVGRAA